MSEPPKHTPEVAVRIALGLATAREPRGSTIPTERVVELARDHFGVDAQTTCDMLEKLAQDGRAIKLPEGWRDAHSPPNPTQSKQTSSG